MAFKAKASAGRIVSMVAKYSSVCKCGAFIETGDQMSYDTITRKSLCYDCLRKDLEFQKRGLSDREGGGNVAKAKAAISNVGHPQVLNQATNELPPRDECHALIDRYRELRLAPRPVSENVKQELRALVTRFTIEFASSEPVRAFVAEISKCKHSGAEYCPIKAKFHSACIHCSTAVQVGQLVLYDHHARRLHCLMCDCLRGI